MIHRITLGARIRDVILQNHMSGGHGGGENGLKMLLAEVGLVVLGLWLLWYFTGGPQRAAQQGDMPFMNAQSPLGNGQVYDMNGDSTPRN